MIDMQIASRIPIISSQMQSLIKAKGCVDPFTIKLKAFDKEWTHMLARYRGLSQFTSRPTFWINANTPDIMAKHQVSMSRINEVIGDNILHEYGHVIAEWGVKRDERLNQMIRTSFPNEEDFAEGFINFARNRMITEYPFNTIMAQYCASRFSKN